MAKKSLPTSIAIGIVTAGALAALAAIGLRDLQATQRAQSAIPDVEGRIELAGLQAQVTVLRDGHGVPHIAARSERDAWFAYPYWLDDHRAPDFARTVDIHRKPGYDPAELFFDPALKAPRLRLARRLLRKKLGFRYRMDVVPLDPSLVKGSHGLPPLDDADGPILVTEDRGLLERATSLADLAPEAIRRFSP